MNSNYLKKMSKPDNKTIISITFCLLIISLFVLFLMPTNRTLNSPPQIILWAWEHPENISNLPSNTGIAYWAETICLHDNDFSVLPRLQTLTIPKHIPLEAVVRIEVRPHTILKFSDQTMNNLAQAIIRPTLNCKVQSLQIDFDTKLDERQLYKNLLQKVRTVLPKNISLSMTALASWSLGDNWLNGLPVNNIVPMFFTMGVGKNESLAYLKVNKNRLTLLQKCVGVSVAEPEIWKILKESLPQMPAKIYIFSPRPWTNESISQIKNFLSD